MPDVGYAEPWPATVRYVFPVTPAKAMACPQTNMLASITVPAGSPTGVVDTHTYQYDVLGRRVRKTVTGTTPSDTVYIHLGQRVYAEYPATVSWSNPSRFYAYGSYVDEPIALIKFAAPGAGQMERFYYHRNQQYSITALTNQAGAVVERYAYTAYGEPTILDAAGTTTRTSSAYGNPYLYTAQAYDSESGLHYFRARMYEGRKGRFLGRDPIEYPDGGNTYAAWFAVSNTDPLGEKECVISILSGHNFNVADRITELYPTVQEAPSTYGDLCGKVPDGNFIVPVCCGCGLDVCQNSAIDIKAGITSDSYQDWFENEIPCNIIDYPALKELDNPINGLTWQDAAKKLNGAVVAAKAAASRLCKNQPASRSCTDNSEGCTSVRIDLWCDKDMESLIMDKKWKGQDIPKRSAKQFVDTLIDVRRMGGCGKSIRISCGGSQ